MIRFLFALLISLLTFSACGVRRPSQVPRESVWVGDKDRGAFVLLGEREGNTWNIRVWDRNGKPLAAGHFVLRGMARATIEPHEFAAWDGRQLALQDGTLLVPSP